MSVRDVGPARTTTRRRERCTEATPSVPRVCSESQRSSVDSPASVSRRTRSGISNTLNDSRFAPASTTAFWCRPARPSNAQIGSSGREGWRVTRHSWATASATSRSSHSCQWVARMSAMAWRSTTREGPLDVRPPSPGGVEVAPSSPPCTSAAPPGQAQPGHL